MLADFRSWLAESAESAEPEVGPAALAAAFTALRHDVQLQTKSARVQAEQAAAALKFLEQREEPATDDPLRPAVKALLDARDALALAGREVERLRGGEVEPLPEAEPLPPPKRGWFGGGDTELRAAVERERAALETWRSRQGQEVDPKFDALLGGYRLSLQRLDRLLVQWDVEPILTVGEEFDPDLMEAVEALAGTEHLPGSVIEEVRPGYIWRGSVLRCALVKVAVPAAVE